MPHLGSFLAFPNQNFHAGLNKLGFVLQNLTFCGEYPLVAMAAYPVYPERSRRVYPERACLERSRKAEGSSVEGFTLSAVEGYIRGNEFWKGETFLPDRKALEPAVDATNWFQKCRHTAQHVGANPLFPRVGALMEIESDDVRLLVELVEHGRHEQPNVGQEVVIAADLQPKDSPQVGFQAKKLSIAEPNRLLNFCGMQIPFGPLVHTWTDMRLVAVKPLDNGRTELAWEGGAKSIDRLEYQRTENKTAHVAG